MNAASLPAAIAYVWALAAAHPAITALVVLALFNGLFKPRTPEEYAQIADHRPTWLFARCAAFLLLLGSLGIDPVKAAKILTEKILKGPPRVPVLLLVVALGALTGCPVATTPREQARSVVLTIAEGVRQGDHTCATLARMHHDIDLAQSCAQIVDEARRQLLTAEAVVDTWDATADRDLPCAAAAASSALSRLLDTVRLAGGTMPPAVEDALRIAPLLAGVCHA